MLLHAFRTAGGSTGARRSVVPRAHDDDQQLYAVLGVPSSASKQEIKSAYKRLVHSLHPDKHQQEQVDTSEAFMRCKAAYEVLSNEQRRSAYDQQLQGGAHPLQEHDMKQQQWNPYQASVDGSSRSRSSTSAQPGSNAAAAAAAAAVSSSGLSAYALRHQHHGLHPLAGLPAGPDRLAGAAAGTCGSQLEQGAALGAALRSVLLSQHGVTLEQFSSLQEALNYLEQQEHQESIVGLAAEDYRGAHPKHRQQMMRHRQEGQHPGMYVRRNSVAGSTVT